MSAIRDILEIDRIWADTEAARSVVQKAALEVSAFDYLIADGFSISIRKVKGDTFLVECHDWEDGNHRSVYGRGNDWLDAVKSAAENLAHSDTGVK